ncbi:hypothetical protein [Streptomyces chromofuscus]
MADELASLARECELPATSEAVIQWLMITRMGRCLARAVGRR